MHAIPLMDHLTSRAFASVYCCDWVSRLLLYTNSDRLKKVDRSSLNRLCVSIQKFSRGDEFSLVVSIPASLTAHATSDDL